MCLLFALLSLIPILSGYAIYLAAFVVITEGSPPVQLTLSVLLLISLLIGGWQLLRYLRLRRR